MAAADLYEVFTSIQGEGLFTGRRQTFVRFSSCNLNCKYCDTIYAQKSGDDVQLETKPYSGSFYTERNPIPPSRLNEYIDLCYKLDPTIHSISLTGGEPLLQWEFIEFFMDTYKKNRIYHLETNGTLPEALEKVIRFVDFISMDIKLNYFGKIDFIKLQEDFLKIAVQKPTQVKIVIEPTTDEACFSDAIDIIAAVNPDIPLIIQPETGKNINVAILFSLQKKAAEKLKNVLILPQMHPLLGVK
jgi:7-carboxy-7-deazaguanine synthase